MMDARAGTALANKPGSIQKQFIDAEIAKVTPDIIFYKIETDLGVLVGYFSLKTGNMGQTAVLFQKTYRPAFTNMIPEIQGNITKFVQSGAFVADILI